MCSVHLTGRVLRTCRGWDRSCPLLHAASSSRTDSALLWAHCSSPSPRARRAIRASKRPILSDFSCCQLARLCLDSLRRRVDAIVDRIWDGAGPGRRASPSGGDVGRRLCRTQRWNQYTGILGLLTLYLALSLAKQKGWWKPRPRWNRRSPCVLPPVNARRPPQFLEILAGPQVRDGPHRGGSRIDL